MSGLHGFLVKDFRLDGIHLEERFRGDTERHAAKRVANVSFSVEDALFLAKNHVGLAGIHVLHDGRDLWASLDEGFHEIAA